MSVFPSHYLQRFEAEVLPKLNASQLEAVNAIDGPVMVIAGPGTGKTELLAARIGNILRLTDTDSREILCLTYTDAGTVAMKRRLVRFLGPEGHRVPVFTFHGFCNQVIQENPAVFGNFRTLQPVSDLERRHLMKQMIDGLDPTHPIRRLKGDAYFNVGRLQSLFDLMNREGFSPHILSDAIDVYITSLPERDQYQYKRATGPYKKGDLKQKDIEEETARMEETRQAALLLPEWQRILEEAGRYDFSDMLRWVHDAFAQDADLLQRHQEQYQFIMVDEYQDTSGLQNAILYLLANYWDQPNLFVVGDDDQAIYRFQGASMSNILGFYEKFKPKIVMLRDNYRSSQAILDAAGNLIQCNLERLNRALGLDKSLNARRTDIALPGLPPQLLAFDASHDEESWIAGKLEALIRDGVKPEKIAVLYRQHKHADRIVHLCRRRGIPIHQQRQENILQDPFILGLIDVLKYIQAEYARPFDAEHLLVRILHLKYFGLVPREIGYLALHLSRRAGDGTMTGPYWRASIGDRTCLEAAGIRQPDVWMKLSDTIESWIMAVPNTTVQVLFEKIITEGGVLQAILQDPQKRRLLELTTALFDHIKRETAANPTLTLGEILDGLKEMIEASIAIPYAYYVGDQHGVTFSTLHAAKGLEWSHVFMIGCNENNWKKRNNGREFRLPDTLLQQIPQELELEEERRLFFVGMTRAEEGLYLTWSSEDAGASALRKKSQQIEATFITNLLDAGTLEVQRMEGSDTIREAMLKDLLTPVDENPGMVEQIYLTEALANKALSVTSINKYLICPRAFYYENVLRIPSARNAAMGYGSAVHRALERLFKANSTLSGNPSEQLLAHFSEAMQYYRSHFSQQEWINLQAFGEQNLPGYVTHFMPLWKEADSVVLEKKFANLEWEGIPITGKLDKIEYHTDGLMVIDYKTGKPENARKKLVPGQPEWEASPGGDYWRQLVFYDMLIRSDRNIQTPMLAGVMEFTEPDKSGMYVRHTYHVTDQDRAIVSAQIHYVWEKIQAMEFNQGCHDPGCVWCNLIDHHIIPVSLTRADAEAEMETD